jgi:hypothetical protein
MTRAAAAPSFLTYSPAFPLVAVRSDNSTFCNAPGALVSYGVRLHNSNIASDIGFIPPMFSDSDFLLGLPFINVSYRW